MSHILPVTTRENDDVKPIKMKSVDAESAEMPTSRQYLTCKRQEKKF